MLQLIRNEPYAPGIAPATLDGNNHILTTPVQTLAGLEVSREITISETDDVAHTIELLHNPTAEPVTTTVRIVGNVGFDGKTTVFATSDGDTIPEPTDGWIGIDGNLSSGALVASFQGPDGLQPSSVSVTGDNIEWTYEVTVPAGQAVRIGHSTVVGGNRDQAVDSPLVTPPRLVGTTPSLAAGTLPSESTSLAISFSEPMVGIDVGGNYQLQSTGPDALLGTADDTIVPLSVSAYDTAATLYFTPLPDELYRLTIRAAITDAHGNAIYDAKVSAGGDYGSFRINCNIV